jgi:hypothetical protein
MQYLTAVSLAAGIIIIIGITRQTSRWSSRTMVTMRKKGEAPE